MYNTEYVRIVDMKFWSLTSGSKWKFISLAVKKWLPLLLPNLAHDILNTQKRLDIFKLTLAALRTSLSLKPSSIGILNRMSDDTVMDL